MLKRVLNYHGGRGAGRGSSDFGRGGGGELTAGALISCLNGAVDSGLAEAAVTREQERLHDLDMRRCLRGGRRRGSSGRNSGYGSSDSDSSDDGQHSIPGFFSFHNFLKEYRRGS